LGLLVLNSGTSKPHREIEAEAIQLVRNTIGPVAAFQLCTVVNRLPKTRSGKILRATIRKIAEGKPWAMPATIDDAAILDEIEEALKIPAYLQTSVRLTMLQNNLDKTIYIVKIQQYWYRFFESLEKP